MNPEKKLSINKMEEQSQKEMEEFIFWLIKMGFTESEIENQFTKQDFQTMSLVWVPEIKRQAKERIAGMEQAVDVYYEALAKLFWQKYRLDIKSVDPTKINNFIKEKRKNLEPIATACKKKNSCSNGNY